MEEDSDKYLLVEDLDLEEVEVLDVGHREDLDKNRQEVLPAAAEDLKDLVKEDQEDINFHRLYENNTYFIYNTFLHMFLFWYQ